MEPRTMRKGDARREMTYMRDLLRQLDAAMKANDTHAIDEISREMMGSASYIASAAGCESW